MRGGGGGHLYGIGLSHLESVTWREGMSDPTCPKEGGEGGEGFDRGLYYSEERRHHHNTLHRDGAG